MTEVYKRGRSSTATPCAREYAGSIGIVVCACLAAVLVMSPDSAHMHVSYTPSDRTGFAASVVASQTFEASDDPGRVTERNRWHAGTPPTSRGPGEENPARNTRGPNIIM